MQSHIKLMCFVLGFYEALLGLLNPVDKKFDVWIYNFTWKLYDDSLNNSPLKKLTSDKRNVGLQLQLIKVLPTPSHCYQYSPEPQRRKDDVFICNCYPNLFPHPEIRTSVPGDLR